MKRLMDYLGFSHSDFAGIVFALLAIAVFALYMYKLEEKPFYNMKLFVISTGIPVLLLGLYCGVTFFIYRIFLSFNGNQGKGLIACVIMMIVLLPIVFLSMNKLTAFVQKGVCFISAAIVFLAVGLIGAVFFPEKATLFYIPIIIMLLCKMFSHSVFSWIALGGTAFCLLPEVYFSIKEVKAEWSIFVFFVFLWMAYLSLCFLGEVKSKTFDVKERMRHIISVKSDRRS